MRWTRSDTIGLADPTCRTCYGLGLRRLLRPRTTAPCGCVLRRIFRSCYRAYLQFADAPEAWRVTWCRAHWGMVRAEYCADFWLISRRHLRRGEWELFRLHIIEGRDYRECCRRLGMERGTFFHTLYRVQEALGRAYRETAPYSLYPVDEYLYTRRVRVHTHETDARQKTRGSVQRPAAAGGMGCTPRLGSAPEFRATSGQVG
jgi:hypothetical protein